MKLLAFLSLSIIPFFVFSQDADIPAPVAEYGKILIGINASADYCNRTLINKSKTATSEKIIELRNEREIGKIGFSTGVNIIYNFSKYFGLEGGIQYSDKGYATKPYYLTYGDMIDPRYGFVYPVSGTNSPESIRYTYNHLFLDIPVRAMLNVGEKKVRFTAGLGITTNILLNVTQTNIYKYPDGNSERKTIKDNFEYRPLNISPTISAGIDYRMCKRFVLRAEPTFRFGAVKIIDAPISAFLWNSGLNVSCYYILK